MDFLHEGVPQMQLKAIWEEPLPDQPYMPFYTANHGQLLKRVLGRLNVCSKEYVVRQYDHEVQGGSTVKPMVGELCDGPSDAGVLRPILHDKRGLVISHGICPKFSALDTYWMMASAIDEAVRNAVAVGGSLRHMAGVDNFCWCDPVQSGKTPDGHHKLAQLVRANQALSDYCLSFGVPCVSGKDSMKNDYTGGGRKISIPPTVLFSVIAVVEDVETCVTSDFKRPGNLIYLLGLTRPELAGSELADMHKSPFSFVPQVNAVQARERYLALNEAMRRRLVASCHDLSDGGLAVAAAEMCIGGRLGAVIDLNKVPANPARQAEADLLYSESNSRLLVEVAPENREAFEALFRGRHIGLIGEVAEEKEFTVMRGETVVIKEPLDELVRAWKEPLDW
jgi:phosphoribosylformylglycinamidine synthase